MDESLVETEAEKTRVSECRMEPVTVMPCQTNIDGKLEVLA